MVPAVEHRAGEHVAEGAEGPVDVGVDHGRGQEVERPDDGEHQGREPHGGGHNGDGDVGDDQVERMVAEGGGPVHLLGAVMHRVERPQGAAVEHPVGPVLEHVGDHQDDQHLHRHRQVRQQAVAGLHGVQHPGRVAGHEDRDHGDQDRRGKAAIDQQAGEEIQQVVREPLGKEGPLPGIARPEPGHQAESQEASRKGDGRPDHVSSVPRGPDTRRVGLTRRKGGVRGGHSLASEASRDRKRGKRDLKGWSVH